MLQAEPIAKLGERLDAHRKAVRASNPDAYFTAQYNALQRHREAQAGGAPLSSSEREFHDRALIGILAELHDELDREVASAYGWPVDLPDEELLIRLAALNRERAREEEAGDVRWLRPDLQAVAGRAAQIGLTPDLESPSPVVEADRAAWPSALPEQFRVVRALFLDEDRPRTLEQVASSFVRARRASVQGILDSLTEVGVLVAATGPAGPTWSAPRSSERG